MERNPSLSPRGWRRAGIRCRAATAPCLTLHAHYSARAAAETSSSTRRRSQTVVVQRTRWLHCASAKAERRNRASSKPHKKSVEPCTYVTSQAGRYFEVINQRRMHFVKTNLTSNSSWFYPIVSDGFGAHSEIFAAIDIYNLGLAEASQ